MREQAEQQSIVLDRRPRGVESRKALLWPQPRRRARRSTWCAIEAIISIGMGPTSQEMEDLLKSHPKVHKVVVAVGTPANGDEKVKAVIVANSPWTSEEMAEYCRAKIADFRMPSLIEFRDSRPKSPTGRIRRGMLRDSRSEGE